MTPVWYLLYVYPIMSSLRSSSQSELQDSELMKPFQKCPQPKMIVQK